MRSVAEMTIPNTMPMAVAKLSHASCSCFVITGEV